MDPQIEARALAEVEVRLAARFPTVAHEVVEAAVRLAQSELTGPVRDFVPVLVEHSARDRLTDITQGAPVPVTAASV